MFNYDNCRVILSCGATDMRKNINGLAEIVYSNFNLDPRDKVIFAFCNNARDRIKLSLLNETLLHADETVLEVLHEPGKELTFTAMGTPDIKAYV